jgi:hypothetical protein
MTKYLLTCPNCHRHELKGLDEARANDTLACINCNYTATVAEIVANGGVTAVVTNQKLRPAGPKS